MRKHVPAIALKLASKEQLDQLIHHKDHNIRKAVAERGHKEHLNQLIKDRSWQVRAAVAEQGQKEHLDKLVNDKEPTVRRAVANYGNPEHHDQLVNDEDPYVRIGVACNSYNPKHLRKLSRDRYKHVRTTAKSRLGFVVTYNKTEKKMGRK